MYVYTGRPYNLTTAARITPNERLAAGQRLSGGRADANRQFVILMAEQLILHNSISCVLESCTVKGIAGRPR